MLSVGLTQHCARIGSIDSAPVGTAGGRSATTTQKGAAGWLPKVAAAVAVAVVCLASPPALRAEPAQCVNILHDEAQDVAQPSGPVNAIMLANLIGHWPHYEIRVRPIEGYRSGDVEQCKATFYLSTRADSDAGTAFPTDFFRTKKSIAWIGFGAQQLDAVELLRSFQHLVSGELAADPVKEGKPHFYQTVAYKGARFRKDVIVNKGHAEGAFAAVRFVPVGPDAHKHVLATLIHSATQHQSPYFLRAANKFVVGDIPFAYMHEADRYFAFADLLFDILDEKPNREGALAFVRIEDIHAHSDLPLLQATLSTLRDEGIPTSIAHIPLFMDPFNTVGRGKIDRPFAANIASEFAQLIAEVGKDSRNAVIWHGTTHQHGLRKNPHSGTSGDDYEFWDMVSNRPIAGDGVAFTFDRLGQGLGVFEAYAIKPRYWVTPHYHASAANNRAFAAAFPWVIGRVTYYASSFKPSFTIKAFDPVDPVAMPGVTRERLAALKAQEWTDIDDRSKGAFTQMFPFEVYRDVYHQRVIPETLGYLSFATSEQTSFVRLPEHMLEDAQRGKVVRDYWASFFVHPYLFAPREDGGVGRFAGDTLELRKLLVGLKMLGFEFVGLPEFETRLSGRLKNVELSKVK